MNTVGFLILIFTLFFGCTYPQGDHVELSNGGACTYDPALNHTSDSAQALYKTVRGALLATRFTSLEELKSVIQIEYFGNSADSAHKDTWVRVRHCSNGVEVVSVLKYGISQGDIWNARYGSFWNRFGVVYNSPYAVVHRKDLEKIYTLSRWRPEWFGAGDLAFFDIAKTSVANINTPDIAFKHSRDSTEKGYLNTFNHITAQAFITSCFSEEVADFIADAHERYHHPELITGEFTEQQVKDLEEGPVDNYADIINNEWGQELGKQLKEKYHIGEETSWTPQLVANYLNDLQAYYSWAFQIGFKPFRPEDEAVIRFSGKINAVLRDNFKKTG